MSKIPINAAKQKIIIYTLYNIHYTAVKLEVSVHIFTHFARFLPDSPICACGDVAVSQSSLHASPA